jgi:hypothetical protein
MKNSSLRRRCPLRNRCNARVSHVARSTTPPLVSITHRLTSLGVLALLHPLAQYLRVLCPVVSASDLGGSSLSMDHLPFHTVQVLVSPDPEYHRAPAQSLHYI